MVELSALSAKPVRKAAELLLDGMAEQATELLRKKAEDGSNDETPACGTVALAAQWRS